MPRFAVHTYLYLPTCIWTKVSQLGIIEVHPSQVSDVYNVTFVCGHIHSTSATLAPISYTWYEYKQHTPHSQIYKCKLFCGCCRWKPYNYYVLSSMTLLFRLYANRVRVQRIKHDIILIMSFHKLNIWWENGADDLATCHMLMAVMIA